MIYDTVYQPLPGRLLPIHQFKMRIKSVQVSTIKSEKKMILFSFLQFRIPQAYYNLVTSIYSYRIRKKSLTPYRP